MPRRDECSSAKCQNYSLNEVLFVDLLKQLLKSKCYAVDVKYLLPKIWSAFVYSRPAWSIRTSFRTGSIATKKRKTLSQKNENWKLWIEKIHKLYR